MSIPVYKGNLVPRYNLKDHVNLQKKPHMHTLMLHDRGKQREGSTNRVEES
jgi:hypothetical protein